MTFHVKVPKAVVDGATNEVLGDRFSLTYSPSRRVYGVHDRLGNEGLEMPAGTEDRGYVSAEDLPEGTRIGKYVAVGDTDERDMPEETDVARSDLADLDMIGPGHNVSKENGIYVVRNGGVDLLGAARKLKESGTGKAIAAGLALMAGAYGAHGLLVSDAHASDDCPINLDYSDDFVNYLIHNDFSSPEEVNAAIADSLAKTDSIHAADIQDIDRRIAELKADSADVSERYDDALNIFRIALERANEDTAVAGNAVREIYREEIENKRAELDSIREFARDYEPVITLGQEQSYDIGLIDWATSKIYCACNNNYFETREGIRELLGPPEKDTKTALDDLAREIRSSEGSFSGEPTDKIKKFGEDVGRIHCRGWNCRGFEYAIDAAKIVYRSLQMYDREKTEHAREQLVNAPESELNELNSKMQREIANAQSEPIARISENSQNIQEQEAAKAEALHGISFGTRMDSLKQERSAADSTHRADTEKYRTFSCIAEESPGVVESLTGGQ